MLVPTGQDVHTKLNTQDWYSRLVAVALVSAHELGTSVYSDFMDPSNLAEQSR